MVEPSVVGLWPLAQSPLPGELLSSWFARNALAHGMKPFSLATSLWGPRPAVMGRDMDKQAPDPIVADLAHATGTSLRRASETGLPAYDGMLVVSYFARSQTQWILPIGLRDRDRRGFGQQFCPACLGTDQKPYFRRKWRLAVSGACLQHGIELLDRCPECLRAVLPLRSSGPSSCWRCRSDLARAESPPASSHLLSFQARAENALAQGWVDLHRTAFSYSHLYFALVRQVAKTLATGPRSMRMREVAASTWGGDPVLPTAKRNRRDVELLPVSDRAPLLDLTERLLTEWPLRFVETCKKAGVWQSWALADAIDPPHAYLQVVETHLRRPKYLPNPDEVAAAVAYLRRTHERPSREALKKLLGHTKLGQAHLPPLAPERTGRMPMTTGRDHGTLPSEVPDARRGSRNERRSGAAGRSADAGRRGTLACRL
ncbi:MULTISPECIES: TniQ family protein [Sphingomonas]|nr:MULTISPECIES: TniQ family protein [Sphingomonas]NJC35325.1 hypothetical protein [Sphingomonas jejuensis]